MDPKKVVAGGVSGGSLGALVVYIASRFKLDLTADDGAWIAYAATVSGAFLAHNGIRGIGSIIWSGMKTVASGPTTP